MNPSNAALALRMVGMTVALAWPMGAQAAQQPEAERVVREACGEDPAPECVAELRKVCHRKMTMRCYLSRKARIDLKRDADDSPERIDERDDRSIFYDE